jgi:hypothetical protein
MNSAEMMPSTVLVVERWELRELGTADGPTASDESDAIDADRSFTIPDNAVSTCGIAHGLERIIPLVHK